MGTEEVGAGVRGWERCEGWCCGWGGGSVQGGECFCLAVFVGGGCGGLGIGEVCLGLAGGSGLRAHHFSVCLDGFLFAGFVVEGYC